MARLFGDEGENDEPKLAGVEHAAFARTKAAASPPPAERPVAEAAVAAVTDVFV